MASSRNHVRSVRRKIRSSSAEDRESERPLPDKSDASQEMDPRTGTLSLRGFLFAELTRGYLLGDGDEQYLERRERVYTFMKTPRELEKLMTFGFFLCMDTFLFIFTFLPIRVVLALLRFFIWPFRRRSPVLKSSQLHDLLRAVLLLVCCWLFLRVDVSVLYHVVRGQSVIKIYVIYNMLDIGDKLLASFGQDTLDSLYWTATEKKRVHWREHAATLFHFSLAAGYVLLHATLVLFQAVALNVAINSHNKSLLTIVISNQFVELKGSAFKKFETNNLFQMSCSDIRERFHYVILLMVVAMRNMMELSWNVDHLWELLPHLMVVFGSEIIVDWIKHAFITKFNSIPFHVYQEYRCILSQDVANSRRRLVAADHCDLVSRRLGFIPIPLAVVLCRVVQNAAAKSGPLSVFLLLMGFLCLLSFKVLLSVIVLGKACVYLQRQQNTRLRHSSRGPHKDSDVPVSPFVAHRLPRPESGAPKHETDLSEIDRFTMCSNRIV